jgi:CHAD domain-containing protein
MSFELKRRESLKKGLVRVAEDEFDDAIERLTKKRSDLVETVHEVRKSMKKLRALLRLVRGAISNKAYRLENESLRDIGHQLSDARDAQILVEALEKLRKGPQGNARKSAAVFDAIREKLEEQRDGINAMMKAKGVFKGLVEQLKKGKDDTGDWAGRASGWDEIEAGLRTSYERGRGAFDTAGKKPTFENYHNWRKRVKDLHYQVRILRPLWPKALKKLSEDTGQLGDLLGDDHDFGVLARLLEDDKQHHFAARRNGIVKAIEARSADLRKQARELGGELYKEKPKVFVTRIAALWKAW